MTFTTRALPTRALSVLAATTLLSSGAMAAFHDGTDPHCTSDDWVSKSDADFAADCANMAFNGSLENRQKLAWMFFARLNLQLAGGTRADPGRADTAPLWMSWPTDQETFVADPNPDFFSEQMVDEVAKPSIPKSVLAGTFAETGKDGAPNGGLEEVTRNKISYDYLIGDADYNLITTSGVQAYINAGNTVQMPVGSIETKAKWVPVTSPETAPEGAFVFEFYSQSKDGSLTDPKYYYWGGLHIMAKMQNLTEGSNPFYDNSPSWFWTTFEFKGNPGVQHVMANLISETAPVAADEVQAILGAAGIDGLGYEAYTPVGTQINFVDGEGHPVILGHTQMEDFAGTPNNAQPQYWDAFQASCHGCHASAAINPDTGVYFPFSVPKGALHPAYNASSSGANAQTYYLGDGFVSLDFMWPIPFNALSD